MPNRIRVAVIDDHPLFREGISSIISKSDRHLLVATGGDTTDAVRIAKEHMPDVILVDISMPGNGLSAVKEISTLCPAVKIMMLTSSEREDDVSNALALGARGYVLKGVGGRELLSTVESIFEGGTYVSPNLAAKLLIQFGQRSDASSSANDINALTHREEEILQLVAQGQTNKEIARELDISEKTVKHYMTNIMQKLQVRNRVEAALIGRARRKAG